MAEIIKFPSTTEKEYVNGTKVAIEIEKEKQSSEVFLNWRLGFSDWTEFNLAERDVELVALFGEHMKLTPTVAARLNAKLAQILCKIKCYEDPLEDYE